MTVEESRRGRRTAYSLRLCDACGAASRETALIALGRDGLAVLTALLCTRCASTVELAVEAAIREIETGRLARELERRRG